MRLIRNEFCKRVSEAEIGGASPEQLLTILGRARAKKGMFEGDLNEGELEIGQVSSLINEIKPAAEIVQDIWAEFKEVAAAPFKY